MAKCEWAAGCPFFTTEVGYSPELNYAMRQEFCLSDNSACARLLLMFRVGIDNVPAEMLPTDSEMIEIVEKRVREE